MDRIKALVKPHKIHSRTDNKEVEDMDLLAKDVTLESTSFEILFTALNTTVGRHPSNRTVNPKSTCIFAIACKYERSMRAGRAVGSASHSLISKWEHLILNAVVSPCSDQCERGFCLSCDAIKVSRVQ